jgi:hypothetical protein
MAHDRILPTSPLFGSIYLGRGYQRPERVKEALTRGYRGEQEPLLPALRTGLVPLLVSAPAALHGRLEGFFPRKKTLGG